MKSFIDWNEVFDELPKALRETLMLEAVQVLSQGKKGKTRRGPRLVVEKGSPPAVLPESLRTWSRDGTDRAPLAAPERHYRVNSTKSDITKGDVKLIWEQICKHKGDFIAYETILKMCGGDRAKAGVHINYLWRTQRLDVQVKE